MNVLDEIRNRYSCRVYRDQPVEQDKLERILEAARLAPSARNLQEWRFVFVRDKKKREQLQAAANNQPYVAQAPVVIVACAVNPDFRMRCGHQAALIDVAIALEHIALQAVREGLATCWIGSFYPDQVRPILGIPAEAAVVELMTLGYPEDQVRPKTRVGVEEIACYDKWEF